MTSGSVKQFDSRDFSTSFQNNAKTFYVKPCLDRAVNKELFSVLYQTTVKVNHVTFLVNYGEVGDDEARLFVVFAIGVMDGQF